MSILKSPAAASRKVIPFPERRAEPIGGELARYIREQNERVMAERRQRENREKAIAVLVCVLAVFVGVLVGVWLAK